MLARTNPHTLPLSKRATGRQGSRRLAFTVISLFVMLALVVHPAQASPPACVFTPVTNGNPFGTVLSADGNFILYEWFADVPGYGPAPQYYVYNRTTRQTTQVSLSYKGETLANDDSYSTRPAISDNGRLSVYFSDARNMVPEYSGTMFQLYARDTKLRTTELVTKNAAGVAANSASWSPSLSTDGRFVAFYSTSTNLVPEDTNSYMDTYVRDRKLNSIERVSVASDGSAGAYTDEYGFSSTDISGDGRYVVFNSEGLMGDDGAVHNGIFLRDRQDERTYWIASGYFPAMTPDARYIVFASNEQLLPEDQSPSTDLYLYDRSSEEFELISAGPDGTSQGSDFYNYNFPSISADGSQVAFSTNNPNLVPDDTNDVSDVFVRNRALSVTERLTVNAQGEQGNNNSTWPSISADGQWLAFWTSATNLLPAGTSKGSIYLCHRVPAAVMQGNLAYLPIVQN